MKCPTLGCPHETSTLETRKRAEGPIRRRKCPSGHRFTTEEVELKEIQELREAWVALKAIREVLHQHKEIIHGPAYEGN